ncbi:MAG: nitronate monooxygenase family protein [Caulobacteraceae bacterium]|nr:nitronate monooxygenase family protein [Caulobacteraceae bacterium]
MKEIAVNSWSDRRILDLFGIDAPIVQAPMAGASTPQMAIAVSQAGGLGSLPAAQYDAAGLGQALEAVRGATNRPINLNFFCHKTPAPDPVRDMAWRARLAPYYVEAGLDPAAPVTPGGRSPFDEAFCALVETHRPKVVSFHFGLPEQALLARVKAAGCLVIASATTVAEAVWLEAHGCDAVIAMGLEAGGHRGSFLTEDMAAQAGTFALVPQVVDAVTVPVIAAGGVADARGIVAALALGASAVQIGTAYLFTPEAKIPTTHRQALKAARDDNTAVTNLFTGRPARGVINRLMRELGPLSDLPPAFPTAGGALAPLRAKAEAEGRSDFTNLWSGQAARLGREMPAGELTTTLAREALALLGRR